MQGEELEDGCQAEVSKDDVLPFAFKQVQHLWVIRNK